MKIAATRRAATAVVLAFALAAPLSGCGGLRRVEVKGNVTLDGKPLAHGLLLFHPDAARGNAVRASCTGPVSNGHYRLLTSAVSTDDSGSGAPVGWYKVTLMTDLPGMKEIPVHKKFLNPQTTPLEVEISDNAPPGSYDLALTTK
jgi:hypothetical protein